jgi:hypothetical protein
MQPKKARESMSVIESEREIEVKLVQFSQNMVGMVEIIGESSSERLKMLKQPAKAPSRINSIERLMRMSY